MRRLMLIALSVAVAAVALSAWSSGTRARAAVVHPRPAAVLRLAPRSLVVPDLGGTACYVGGAECSQTPCVQFTGAGGARPLVAAESLAASARRLGLRALSQMLAAQRGLALSRMRPAPRTALSVVPYGGGRPCRRVAPAAPELVGAALAVPELRSVSVVAGQTAVISKTRQRGPALSR